MRLIFILTLAFALPAMSEGTFSGGSHANTPATPMAFIDTQSLGWPTPTANDAGIFDSSIDIDNGTMRGEQIIYDEWTGEWIVFDDASATAGVVISKNLETGASVIEQTILKSDLATYLGGASSDECPECPFADAAQRENEPELIALMNSLTLLVVNNVNAEALCDGAIVDFAGMYTLTRTTVADDWVIDGYVRLPGGNCEGDGVQADPFDTFLFRYQGMMSANGKVYFSTGNGGTGGTDYTNDRGDALTADVYEWDLAANDLARTGGVVNAPVWTFPPDYLGAGWPGVFKLNYHHGSGLMHSVGLDQAASPDQTHLVEVDWLHPDGPTTIGIWNLNSIYTSDADVTFGLDDTRTFTHDPITGRGWFCHNGSNTVVAQCPGVRMAPRPWLVNRGVRKGTF